MTLRQPGLVRPEDQRQVREPRQRRAERLVEENLARRVGDVVVAADDVGDAHVHVVDDDAEVVDRRAVGAQDDEVVQVGVLEHDGTLHQVVDHGLAVERGPEAERVVSFDRMAHR